MNGVTPEVVVLKMVYQVMINYNYLIIDPVSRQAVIVDPAWELDKVDEALKDNNAKLAGVLITHTHPDHINLAIPVAEKYGCPIWMSRQEIEFSGFEHSHLFAIGQTPWFVGQMLIEPLFTPGHTPGCICYLIGDNLFTGDTLFAEGVGICKDMAGAYTLYESIQFLKQRLADNVLVYPGHKYVKPPGQPFGDLRKDNIYLQFKEKSHFGQFLQRKMLNR